MFDEITGGGEEIELGKKTVSSRAYVSWFNFKGRDQQKKTGMLSGGERNRVHLAKLLRKGSNLLLLDEPTNDLDVDTLRALEDALLEFAGCAVVISHDRWFLDRIATHILAFEGDSKVVWFEGNYQDYEADRQAPPRRGRRPAAPHQVPQADPVTTMTTPEIQRRPAALWKAMTDAQRQAAAEAFWADDESVAEQTEVMLLLSKKLNFRYKSVEGMAPERKTTHLLKLAQVSEGVAARLLVTYHLATQRRDDGRLPRRSRHQARGWADRHRRRAEARARDARDGGQGDRRRLPGRGRAALFHDAADAGPGDLGRPRPVRTGGVAGRPDRLVLPQCRRHVGGPARQAGTRQARAATAANPSAALTSDAGSVAETPNSSASSSRPTSSAPATPPTTPMADQPRAFGEHQPDHLVPARPDRLAHRQFLGPRPHRQRQHAVEPDGGQQRRDDREAGQQPQRERLRRGRLRDGSRPSS